MLDVEGAVGVMEALQREQERFRAMLPSLLPQHAGKWAIVKNGELASIYDTAADGYKDGVRRFGLEPFLLVEIREEECPAQMPAFVTGLMYAHI